MLVYSDLPMLKLPFSSLFIQHLPSNPSFIALREQLLHANALIVSMAPDLRIKTHA